MINNPYMTLGVGLNATKEEIRTAYRNMAKKHHPDAGGERGEFEKITLAHEVLMDDDRRTHFDQTGVIDQKIAGVEAEAIKRLNVSIKNAAQIARQKAVEHNRSPMSFDVLALAKNNLVDHLKEVNSQANDFDKRLKFFSDLAARFQKVDDGEDIIAKIFAEDILSITAAKESCEKEVKLTNAALRLFEGYTFKKDDDKSAAGAPGLAFIWHGFA